MAGFKTIEGMDFAGKRVLLRADLNVPVQDGKVTDATRIERVVPTIREITKAGVFQDMKKKRFYESPAVQRRRKSQAARRRNRTS